MTQLPGAWPDADDTWRLRLYVAGQSPKSLRALGNLERICADHLSGRYELEVVDLVSHPARAQADDILAIPTLVCSHTALTSKIIGDLSDTPRVLAQLRLDQ